MSETNKPILWSGNFARPEIDLPENERDPSLGRYYWRDEKGELHARWEGEDGLGARAPWQKSLSDRRVPRALIEILGFGKSELMTVPGTKTEAPADSQVPSAVGAEAVSTTLDLDHAASPGSVMQEIAHAGLASAVGLAPLGPGVIETGEQVPTDHGLVSQNT